VPDTDHADVLIIGAGASGGVAARRLAERGLRVVCLEQGEWPDPAAYRGAEPDWELAIRKEWSSSPNVRQRAVDYPIDLAESDMSVGNFNGVGGGTVLFAGVWPRLLPSDFRRRRDDGVGDDWPLTYDELAPYYEATDRAVGVSGLGGNPAYPPGPEPPLLPLPIGRAGLLLARAHAQLGWHWWPESNAILSDDYGGRHRCVQRGTCGAGCSEGAKGSTDVTHWPGAVAAGAHLITNARVHRIVTDERGLVAGAEWLDAGGRARFASADVVLCAANGIGTARLLLLSDGLANSSGLVGRRLMLHPIAMIAGFFDDELESWQGQYGGSIQSLEFYVSRADRDHAGAAKWSLAPTGGPLGVALAPGRRPFLGPDHHEVMRERFGRGAQWIVLCEDSPDEQNRVELSGDVVDSSGIAAPKVVYRISDDTRRCMDFNIDRAIESLTAAGARSTDAVRLHNNSHLLGTARMGDDPRTSVVDRWSIAHDVPNLGIVDGSVFVTAGAVNPTSTICALALRAVDHLVENRAEVPVPRRARVFPAPAVGRARPQEEKDAPVEPLTAAARERLRALADAMLPGDELMPSASDAGVGDNLIDWVFTVRPDLAEPVARAVAADVENAAARLDDLRHLDREAYHGLVLAVVAAYYHSPDVCRRMGYPGQVAKPVHTRGFPEYVAEGLLDFMLGETEETS
jgi:choline dehydrogenase-like flavoprotein